MKKKIIINFAIDFKWLMSKKKINILSNKIRTKINHIKIFALFMSEKSFLTVFTFSFFKIINMKIKLNITI